MTYVFFRNEGFYFVDLKDDADAIENAHHNPGTLRVETMEGREVFNADKAN
jgi:hypothetical protein